MVLNWLSAAAQHFVGALVVLSRILPHVAQRSSILPSARPLRRGLRRMAAAVVPSSRLRAARRVGVVVVWRFGHVVQGAVSGCRARHRALRCRADEPGGIRRGTGDDGGERGGGMTRAPCRRVGTPDESAPGVTVNDEPVRRADQNW